MNRHVRQKLVAWLGDTAATHDPAVYFGPQQIREHYDGIDSPHAAWVAQATDKQLLEVGQDALWDDRTWAAYHATLTTAIHHHQHHEG